jgi:hypothetical protein
MTLVWQHTLTTLRLRSVAEHLAFACAILFSLIPVWLTFPFANYLIAIPLMAYTGERGSGRYSVPHHALPMSLRARLLSEAFAGDHRFRAKSMTDSGGSRSLIPDEGDQCLDRTERSDAG